MARTTGTITKTSIKPKTAELKFAAPKAKKVSIAGTFNNWNTDKNIARKDSQGNWIIKLDLTPGKYEYKFFVDGQWANDPSCKKVVSNQFGTQNCILEIR